MRSRVVGRGSRHRDGRTIRSRCRKRFGGRRFNAVEPPELLDYEGAEVVLVGAGEDAEAELGIRLDAVTERLENADLLRRLRLRAWRAAVEAFEHESLAEPEQECQWLWIAQPGVPRPGWP